MRIMNLSELEQYTEELSEKYNVKASITEQGRHLAVFPPQGGMWITEWYLHINSKKILVGNDYNETSIEELKSKIESIIRGEVT